MEFVAAVAKFGTFTEAARHLHVAQPAVSAQIAAAERELGATLFQRSRLGAKPTQVGLLVIERARRIGQEMAELRDDVDAMNGLLRGELRVGMTPLRGCVDVPSAVQRFRVRHPAVTLTVRTGLINPLLDALADGDLDLVIGPLDGTESRPIHATVLHEESLCLISPPGQTVQSLAELAIESFICLPQGSGLRQLLNAACDASGFSPRVDFEVSDPREIPEYVAAGIGHAIIAASILQNSHNKLGRSNVSLPDHPPFGVITGKTSTRASTAFQELLEPFTSRA